MTEKSPEDLDRLERISRRVTPRAPSRGPKIAAGVLIVVLLGVGALWTFAPEQVRSLFGFGTSRPQDMQQPAAFDAGISTEVPRAKAVDTAPLSAELPVPQSKAEGLSPEDQLRLSQMEDRLRALADQPGGMTRDELQAMLDANAAHLRAEVERQLLAQNSAPGVDPNGAAAGLGEAHRDHPVGAGLLRRLLRIAPASAPPQPFPRDWQRHGLPALRKHRMPV